MRRLSLLFLLLVILAAIAAWFLFAPGASQPVPPQGEVPPVPSGQRISFIDRTEEAGGAVRFRFLAPQLAEGTLADESSADMQALCDNYALAHLPQPGNPPAQIIVSLSQQAVPLGEVRPDVVQVFEAYRIEGGKCVWEMF